MSTPPPPDDAPAPARAAPRRAPTARLVLLFLASLLVVAGLLRHAAPWPPGGGLGAKLRAYHALADEIDVVVLGTSRVARGVIPAVLDAELARRGHPLRSFNLAALGMNALETDHVLDAVLARGGERLRAVVVEVDDWRPALETTPGVRARDVHWHDLRRTATALEALWHLRRFGEPWTLLAVAARELERAALDLLSIGRGAWWIGEWLAPAPHDPLDAPSAEQARALRGHHPYDEPHGAHFLEQLALAERTGEPSRFEKLLAGARAPTARDRNADAYLRAALRRQIERVRAAGVLPVYLLPPSVKTRAWIRTLHDEGELPVLLDFGDPARHPELFDRSRRYDVDHLNQLGATEFSRALGARLADVLDAAGDAPGDAR